MQKLSGNSSGKSNKGCSTSHQESNKIGFAFFKIFYNFLCILQDSAEHNYYLRFTFATRPLTVLIPYKDTLGSHKTPQEEYISCNVALGGEGRRGSPELGGSGDALGRESGRRGLGAHQSSICVLGWGRKAAGGGGRRHQAAAAAGVTAPVRRPAQPGHEEHGEFGWCKGEELRMLLGCASAQKGHLSDGGMPGGAATACTREEARRAAL
jgi:hypothetical protein